MADQPCFVKVVQVSPEFSFSFLLDDGRLLQVTAGVKVPPNSSTSRRLTMEDGLGESEKINTPL